MTVLTNKTRNDYVGTGGVTTYAYQFKIFNDSELLVYRSDEFGNATLLTLNTDYTVTGAGDAAGGDVVLTTALPNNYTLAILRNLPLTQETAFRNQGAFYPARHEDAFDKSVMLAQQISEELGRVVVAPPSTNPGVSFQLPAPDPDHILGWNTAGTALENKTGISTDGMVDLANQVDPAKGAALVGWLPNLLNAFGRPLSDKLLEYVSVKDFGAVGDGINDDTACIQAAIDSGMDVFIPKGVFLIDSIYLNNNSQCLFGGGKYSVLKQIDADNNTIYVREDNVSIFNLSMFGISTDETTNGYAIFTEEAHPLRNLSIRDLLISSDNINNGYNNAIKFDNGIDDSIVCNCFIENVLGINSDHGYGILSAGDGNIFAHNNIKSFLNSGRHGIYLSVGASYNIVASNVITGFDKEAISQFSQGTQDPCTHNIYIGNNINNTVTGGNVTSGGIGIYGHCNHISIIGNSINNSGGKGIVADGTGFLDCNNVYINSNIVTNSSLIGIDMIAVNGGSIIGNIVNESSLIGSDTHSNIRLISDNVTPTNNIIITGNKSSGPLFSRSAFQLNSSAPAPSDLKVYANKFDQCVSGDIELNSVVCAIDGYLWGLKSWDIPSLATLTSSSTTISIPGASISDIVNCTVRANGSSEMVAGLILTGFVSSSDTVTVTVANLSASTIDPINSNLIVSVFKK